MKYRQILSLAVLSQLVIGCASFGPTVLIETPKPAQDFVVVCEWYVEPMLKIHGGGQLYKRNIYVTESGKEVDCGVALGGDPLVHVMHPVYWDADVTEQDGFKVYRYTKTKLDHLDEIKARFDAGEYDKNINPGAEFARRYTGCGFPKQYFDYYSESKPVSKEHFRKLYNDEIYECLNRVIPVWKKYLRGFESYPDAGEYLRGYWNSDTWNSWNE
jgi:hypothetical protein